MGNLVFAKSVMLVGENPPSLQRLRRILCAYSFRNPHTGYCQGMNFLAAYLLNVFDDEEDAFWLLSVVIERLLPNHYYDSNLKGIKAEADLFEIICAKEVIGTEYLLSFSSEVCARYATQLPRLNRHLQDHGIDMPMCTLEWFVSLFTMSFRSKLSLRIWDLFLYEGRVSLFCVALSLVKLHEEKLLQFNSMDRLYDALKSLPSFNYNADAIIQHVRINSMSAMVKRLSFGIIQSQTLSETITTARQTTSFMPIVSSLKKAHKTPPASPSVSRASSNASSYKSFRSNNNLSGVSQQSDGDADSQDVQFFFFFKKK